MPATVPQPDGWRIATAYRAARIVGGDFYDAYELPARPGRIGFVVADVTGKGVTAALMMAFARAVMRSAAYNGSGPADALERTNHVLAGDARTGLFVTAFVGELDPATSMLRHAAAGHEPPLLCRAATGRAADIDVPGTPLLGAFTALGATELEVRLAPGDVLLAYTDGVTDAQDPDGTRFGDGRLRATVEAAAGGGAAALLASVLAAVDTFARGSPPADDITLLALERVGQQCRSEGRLRPASAT
jgi:serine phosphatase RsbU (regulator of sigma subunit)